ncbi:MAG: hypothetical protein RBG13Loki_1373 [Promethearchaeota archaeon CR_4]|nr:MAG: hypothetical protein RBG13Loki_1373 [Candidatus Lokiarchaeota archaeon CR_4]
MLNHKPNPNFEFSTKTHEPVIFRLLAGVSRLIITLWVVKATFCKTTRFGGFYA